ncbi:MAG: hypothetical protein QHH10_10550 [Peptococcaceae bacterium]|jgi:methanogen homocitrate synthase|nr:hypothetical protein [Peptococcaceae bacterium]MDH7525737.1 hypothetical protein [Peptococcaceae bacterium]
MNYWKNENWWISNYNFCDEVRRGIDIKPGIKLHDATLRDGEQTPGIVLKKDEKVEIARRMSEAGIHRIEAGMPAVSEEDRSAIEEIKKLGLKTQVFSFARAMAEDIKMAADCGADGVVIEVPIGKPKLELQFKWEVDRVIEMSLKGIQAAREYSLYTVLFPYDTTRADETDLDRFLSVIMAECPPDSIGLVDTMGSALPMAIRYLTRYVKEKTKLPVEIHTHNDFGLSLAGSIEAVLSGAEVVHCCMNGIGERTGNCATEEVAAALQLLLGVELGIEMQKLVELSGLVETMTGFRLAANKPIVGEGNFTRESGIGADTLLKAPLAMFAINPGFLGREPRLVLGKKSGLTSIEMKLKALEIELDQESKSNLLKDVKNMGIEKKRYLTDEEFLGLLKKYRKQAKKSGS